jgi:hypothetical protein
MWVEKPSNPRTSGTKKKSKKWYKNVSQPPLLPYILWGQCGDSRKVSSKSQGISIVKNGLPDLRSDTEGTL